MQRRLPLSRLSSAALARHIVPRWMSIASTERVVGNPGHYPVLGQFDPQARGTHVRSERPRARGDYRTGIICTP